MTDDSFQSSGGSAPEEPASLVARVIRATARNIWLAGVALAGGLFAAAIVYVLYPAPATVTERIDRQNVVTTCGIIGGGFALILERQRLKSKRRGGPSDPR